MENSRPREIPMPEGMEPAGMPTPPQKEGWVKKIGNDLSHAGRIIKTRIIREIK